MGCLFTIKIYEFVIIQFSINANDEEMENASLTGQEIGVLEWGVGMGGSYITPPPTSSL